MSAFTMDGYRDLDDLLAELRADGFLFRISEVQAKELVAVVLLKLTERVNENLPREHQERELLMGVSGIVDCAERDGIL